MKKEAAKLGVLVGYKLALWPYESGNKNTQKELPASIPHRLN